MSTGFFFLLLFFFQLSGPLQAEKLEGLVVDQKGNPVQGARVRLQTTERLTLTDARGRFSLETDGDMGSRLTAWKSGYYNGGELLYHENGPRLIVLKPVPQDDNQAYQWIASQGPQDDITVKAPGEARPCQTCHPGVTAEWKKDAHSRAAVNPVFLAFYNGTGQSGPGAGSGYKLDFPRADGNCCTCHLPIMSLSSPFGADPNKAQGPALEGLSCDFCHKIDRVELDRTGGFPGVLSMKLNRPDQGHQIFYGPYDDVFPGEDSYHPLYKQSLFCAPCHHGKFWDVLVYPEFQEWAESGYAKDNIHCQACHMKPGAGTDRFALEREGGLIRDPQSIPSHVNFGLKDREFMKEALGLKTSAELKGDILTVTVRVENVGAGHHYPTGNPMRNMILLVMALDGQGRALTMIQGQRVPDWGGVGPAAEGNYAGLPGKGFAKILRDRTAYPNRGQRRDFPYEYPAPHWRPTIIESDSRIPANQADLSLYRFRVPPEADPEIKVLTKLLFRRTFKNWDKLKKLGLPDLEVGSIELILGRPDKGFVGPVPGSGGERKAAK